MKRPSSRAFAAGAALFLGAAMAVLSYDHALIVARETGTEPHLAYLVPLLPDGMFVLSTAALYDAMKARASRPPWAIVGLLLGGGVTVVMNVAAGWPDGWGGRLVFAMPPVFLIVAIEILVGVFRRPRSDVNDDISANPDQAEPPPLEVALARLAETYSQRQLATALDVPRARLQRFIATVNGSGSQDEDAVAGDHLN